MELKKRLLGLDVMRGITMAAMLLVDELGDAYPSIGHAPWDGLHLADLVMPYFLLISGMSASISLKRTRWLPVFGRALRLFLLGIAVQGSIFHITAAGPLLKMDLPTLRVMGILQRIALVFLIVATLELSAGAGANVRSAESAETESDGSHEAQSQMLLNSLNPGLGLWVFRRTARRWLSVLLLVLVGGLLTYMRPPSSWPGCAEASAMSSSQVHGERLRDMGCSGCGWLDSLLLGVDHLYIRGTSQKKSFGFDPEGLVTTLSAVFCMFSGLHVGRVAQLLDLPATFLHWMLMALSMVILGLSMTHFVPFNKRLWSPSYSLFTTGTGICLYSLIFFICDLEWSRLKRLRQGLLTCFRPFQWLGSNCIFFFVLSECCGVFSWLLQSVTWGDKNVVRCFRDFLWHSCGLGKSCAEHELCGPVEVAYTATGLVFWMIVCGLLHRRGIFWKV